MTTKARSIVRNVRFDAELDEKIQAIAAAEDRTISNATQRLLRKAVRDYLERHPELLVTTSE